MFSASRIMSEVTGTADNHSVHFGADIASKSEFLGYLLTNEAPIICLKSHRGEVIFTDRACITVIGENTVGKKKTLRRFEFRDHMISNVHFETAGIDDFDCEIKFSIDNQGLSFDIKKSEQPNAMRLYRALSALSFAQQHNSDCFKNSLGNMHAALGHVGVDKTVAEMLPRLVMEATEGLRARYCPYSYREVLEMELR